MSQRPAAALTNAIIASLHRRGCYAWRAQSTGVATSSGKWRTAPKKGVSDVLALCPPNGQMLAIEVKIGRDRLSDEQEGFLKNVEHVGGRSFVAKDIKSFDLWYSNLDG